MCQKLEMIMVLYLIKDKMSYLINDKSYIINDKVLLNYVTRNEKY